MKTSTINYINRAKPLTPALSPFRGEGVGEVTCDERVVFRSMRERALRLLQPMFSA